MSADVFAVAALPGLLRANACTNHRRNSMADEAPSPRLTGAALWKAERDAVEQRNAAARRRAHEHVSATSLAASSRERSLEKLEAEQLRVLNARLDARS